MHVRASRLWNRGRALSTSLLSSVAITAGIRYSFVRLLCSHYGAPLAKGVLSGNRVVCPWHAACFNVATGDIEDGCVLMPTAWSY